MALLNIFKKPDAPTTNTARPDERSTQLEQVVREHAALREAVSSAQSAFETHDRFLRDRYLNPAQPADLGIEDSVEEQRRRSLRYALGEAQLALAEFEKKYDIPAIRAELADIQANADLRERAAARREVIDMMVAFDHEVLRIAEARWSEIRRRLIEVEDRWPGQRVVVDLPHAPDGIFYPDGPRSIPVWYREKLCLAQADLFDEHDPVRARIDAMRAQGNIIIRDPSRFGADLSSDGLSEVPTGACLPSPIGTASSSITSTTGS